MITPSIHPNEIVPQSSPNNSGSAIATPIVAWVPNEAGGVAQPEEAAASPNSRAGSTTVDRVVAGARDTFQPPIGLGSSFAIDRTASFNNVGNASVNNTNASLTTDTSDTDMVDIGTLTIQPDVQANNVGAPGNIVSTVRFGNTIIPPIGEAMNPLTRPPVAHPNFRASFIEDLEEELPPAYEEYIPANSRRSSYVLNTPPPAHRTRWIGRDSYRPRSPRRTRTQEATPTNRRPRSSSSRFHRQSTRPSPMPQNRTQTTNIRRSLPPASAQSYMSSSSSSPSPPSSPVPTIPATPRMRPARPPIMDGRTSAALTVTMFFRCLRSIRLTLSTFPANHPYAAHHRQLRNETDLMELWFHNHHEHLQQELDNPQSPARLVYRTLFSCAGHLIQLTNLPPTYNPLDPTM
ncbi:hypothetical protein MJO28_015947 [Puccinia striiformis f. sp. tritici]|uniref:Uncharacterized protein n=1 Tax=Puccinia striiformis f. sp. tritici TaxID=168172 RepID=A0ACC0DQ80_9BASI|nr:hypothetical protein Pst134EA_017562 [Puccinia striiformis f. sp. tritici]KAH9461255.1 hypothetical protein Pst134EA_017562 [Puccinia striiformis f. sp. tritici]KAI7937048.1 hypothetical protein MJO28_015947 [Puccinia striiformis f. sp. tritici]KAI7950694.1 hypothetical protein MJO29_009368 [Puccinia striiformis f. sp. tritici]